MITFEKLQIKPFKNQKITGLVPEVSQLAETVPELKKWTELVPGGVFLKEKSFLVIGKSKCVKNGPWVESLVKLQVWSFNFGNWQL